MPSPTPFYVERLSIRARWWAVVLVIALFGSSELFAGFNGRVIAVVAAAVLVPTVALLALVLGGVGAAIQLSRRSRVLAAETAQPDAQAYPADEQPTTVATDEAMPDRAAT